MTESTDKPLPDEQQLDEYLKGDSSVSRQYRQLHSAEVPAELDRLVLRQAEDAVKKSSTTRPAWVRWTAPLAVAASAVLVLSIVIEHGVRDTTVQQMSPAQAPEPAQAQQYQRAERKVEQEIVPEHAAPAPAEPQALAKSANDNQAAGSAADAVSPAYAPAELPPPPKIEVPPPQAMTHAAPARPAAPPPPSVATPAPAPEVTAGESVARSADIATRMVQPANVEAAAQIQQATVPNERAREEDRSVAKRAFSQQISAPRPARAPQSYTDPEEWLKAIRHLREENKQEQADSEWRRFRAAFPDYEVAETDTAREARK